MGVQTSALQRQGTLPPGPHRAPAPRPSPLCSCSGEAGRAASVRSHVATWSSGALLLLLGAEVKMALGSVSFLGVSSRGACSPVGSRKLHVGATSLRLSTCRWTGRPGSPVQWEPLRPNVLTLLRPTARPSRPHCVPQPGPFQPCTDLQARSAHLRCLLLRHLCRLVAGRCVIRLMLAAGQSLGHSPALLGVAGVGWRGDPCVSGQCPRGFSLAVRV